MNPYPKILADETSGVEVPNEKHYIWEEGFKAKGYILEEYMADRKCSCCGLSYTDESGHDLDKCIEDCQSYLLRAEKDHINAREDLERAFQRKIAQLRQNLAQLTMRTQPNPLTIKK